MPPHAALEATVLAEPCSKSHKPSKVSFDRGHSRRLSDTFSSFFDAIRCRSADVKTNAIKRIGKLADKEQAELNLSAKASQEVGPVSKEARSMRYKPCIVEEAGCRQEASDCARLNQDEKTDAAENNQTDESKIHFRLNNAICRQLIEQDQVEAKELPGTEQKQELDAGERITALKECEWVVKQLSSERIHEQRKAAMDIKRIAGSDAESRVTLAMLGAIPPLVGMLDSSSCSLQGLALQALINLAIGKNVNKSAIVSAGAVTKMLKLLTTPSNVLRESAMAALLSLSALDANKLVIGTFGAIPPLINILEQVNLQARKDALRILYNLSICPGNISAIVDTKAVDLLLEVLYETPLSEKALAIIGNLTATERGRMAIMQNKDALPVLIDVLSWADASKCQERAVYVLMVLAHHSWSYRQALASMGAVSVLLELILLGSSVSQRRAERILDTLRDNKQDGRSVTAPDMCAKLQEKVSILESKYVEVSEEKRLVNHMVQESLQKNMDRIFNRARLPSIDAGQSEHKKNLAIIHSFNGSRY
ncbi:hypothetical protein O6H91_10G102000 [Diphasiastrum complanatum]|uniref:Uncharacterized protein n=3 Tax=Diphasiastrum complanatum TaxID=34168 RepID=A0ACC2CK26_DIPCM|nr:hypothetical protein O6H91_10G102000 [Diphasiastrum complanatum]